MLDYSSLVARVYHPVDSFVYCKAKQLLREATQAARGTLGISSQHTQSSEAELSRGKKSKALYPKLSYPGTTRGQAFSDSATG